MNCFTRWRAARSTSRMLASTFTSQDEYGFSSTDGSLAMLARWNTVSYEERSISSIFRTSIVRKVNRGLTSRWLPNHIVSRTVTGCDVRSSTACVSFVPTYPQPPVMRMLKVVDGPLAGARAVHVLVPIEPVVENDLMGRFRPPVAGQRHVEIEVAEGARLVVGAHAGQGDGSHAQSAGDLERADDIRRVTGAADRDQHIARAGEPLERQREHFVVREVVAGGRQERRIVEGERAQAAVLGCISRHMAGHAGAAAVADDVEMGIALLSCARHRHPLVGAVGGRRLAPAAIGDDHGGQAL